MQQQPQWVTPSLRRYGTFESTTQEGCDKQFGASDSYTFQGQVVVCAS